MSQLLDIRKGICPICNGQEIVYGTHQAVDESEHGFEVRPLSLNQEISTSIFLRKEVERFLGVLRSYICCDCGYTQMFTQGIEKIKRKLQQVGKGNNASDPYR